MILEKLVDNVDFKPYSETVDNQRRLGSCLAFTAQTYFEVAYKRAGISIDLSPMYLYYFIQEHAGNIGTDGGGWPSALGDIVKNNGVCLEQDWPYLESMLGVRPYPEVIQKARKIFPPDSTSYTTVTHNVRAIKQALNRGQPVVFGMLVHKGFEQLKGTNWKEHEWDTSTPPIGLHAVTVIGYNEASNRFLIENSWGPAFGDGGYFGLPYSYIGGNCVLQAFIFDKLPVPYIPVEGYIEDSIPEFDINTGLLYVPTIGYSPGNLQGTTTYRGVVIQLEDAGKLVVNDPNWPNAKEPYYIHEFGSRKERRLGFPRIKFKNQDQIYTNVTLLNPVGKVVSVVGSY